MGYKVKIKESAKKELAKLDRQVQRRLIAFMLEIEASDNPRISGIAMQGNMRAWRYRVGDYRMIAEIQDSIITIEIIKVGHRRDIYR
ncbi:MAG: type II toxin-antitoxin system RelE/ParE family toxin [Sideroxydans sp.]|nr:type II toxin-antitoxin system RelE/ParE family toxin [Sideroxydans sp.]